MAFSLSNSRSRSQESPMLWLSVLAGSLALHLVLLLVGRWYLSQSAESRAGGGSQAPLDFIEIDPNAPPLKRAISPSTTGAENGTVTKAAPDAANSEQSGSSSIQNFTRQTAPTPTQPENLPQPDPVQSTQLDQRPAANNSSLNSPRANRNPTTRPKSNSSNPTSGSSNPETNPTAPNNSPTTTRNASDPNPPNSSNPQPSNPALPDNNPKPPSDPVRSNNPLPAPNPGDNRNATGVEGAISGVISNIEPDRSELQDDSKNNVVTFRQSQIPQISLILEPEMRRALSPELVFTVAVEIRNVDGTVLNAKNMPDSPALAKLPREEADGLVLALLTSPDLVNPDKAISLFNVEVRPSAPGKPTTEGTSRIVTLRIAINN
ncbi:MULTISPECIES: hypothetical protein [Leptolyngbya]|nr:MULTISPECIES: hypothetical protein [Leptolyngbya]MBD2368121.1 hypothetical protein [Leptolyngbya sp. FACHB-161]MBD2374645.1 hypothetical protein [Leptolyngbya sp. FACHB-238]MBD2399067.1 hypothetical protein [Leptolyngbya sp. FACHB-239]MBD2405456.1 hypothetical protein [Leptolyngbya sp. FACHB-402]ULP29520.1 hypothetical protein MCP04_26415 [Leptolyngbya boryana IU 594]